jgi:hypothetical protein
MILNVRNTSNEYKLSIIILLSIGLGIYYNIIRINHMNKL